MASMPLKNTSAQEEVSKKELGVIEEKRDNGAVNEVAGEKREPNAWERAEKKFTT